MQKLTSHLLMIIAPCLMAVSLQAPAAELFKLRVNVQQEKRNAIVHFDNAAIGQVGAPPGSGFNAFIGVTNDFGGTLPVYVVFKEFMAVDQASEYAEHQGRNHGQALCALVQKGSSPDIPSIPVAVLAQNCSIQSVAF